MKPSLADLSRSRVRLTSGAALGPILGLILGPTRGPTLGAAIVAGALLFGGVPGELSGAAHAGPSAPASPAEPVSGTDPAPGLHRILPVDPALVGSWRGTLEVPPGARLPLVFHLSRDDDGNLSATMDSPAQGVTGIPVARVLWDAEAEELILEIPVIGGRFRGTRRHSDLIEGEWSQGGLTLPLALGRLGPDEVVAGPPRPQHPEPPFPYREEDVAFVNAEAGIALAGTLTLPDPATHGPGPWPAVALITGSGPQDRDETLLGHKPFLVLADHLTRAGVVVLRYDDRGVGASGGDFQSATTVDFAGDAAAAVDFLRGRPEVDPRAVGLLGHSEGGLIAPMVATGVALLQDPSGPILLAEARSHRRALDFVILLAGPGVPGSEILLLQSEAISRAGGMSPSQLAQVRALQEGIQAIIAGEADEEARRTRLEAYLRETVETIPPGDRGPLGIPPAPEGVDGWIQAQLASAGGPWFRTFLLLDPRGALEELRVPVLALFGGLDLQVPAEENRRAMEAALARAGNPDASLQLFPGLNHLFQEAGTGHPAEYAQIEETLNPRVLEWISAWILERFGR